MQLDVITKISRYRKIDGKLNSKIPNRQIAGLEGKIDRKLNRKIASSYKKYTQIDRKIYLDRYKDISRLDRQIIDISRQIEGYILKDRKIYLYRQKAGKQIFFIDRQIV